MISWCIHVPLSIWDTYQMSGTSWRSVYEIDDVFPYTLSLKVPGVSYVSRIDKCK